MPTGTVHLGKNRKSYPVIHVHDFSQGNSGEFVGVLINSQGGATQEPADDYVVSLGEQVIKNAKPGNPFAPGENFSGLMRDKSKFGARTKNDEGENNFSEGGNNETPDDANG